MLVRLDSSASNQAEHANNSFAQHLILGGREPIVEKLYIGRAWKIFSWLIRPLQYYQSFFIKREACWSSNLLKYLNHRIVLISKAEVKEWKWISTLPVFEWFRQIQFSRSDSNRRRLRLGPQPKPDSVMEQTPQFHHFPTVFLCEKHTVILFLWGFYVDANDYLIFNENCIFYNTLCHFQLYLFCFYFEI